MRALCLVVTIFLASHAIAKTNWFPRTSLFLAPIAGPKETMFSTSIRQVHFKNNRIPGQASDTTIWFLGLSEEFPVVENLSETGISWQMGVYAGSFSQFNLDSETNDLLNTDFVGGGFVSISRNCFSTRMRLYHQSSHLGDELILQTPKEDRKNLSFEGVELLGAYEFKRWRFYAGGNYFYRSLPNLDPFGYRMGFEASLIEYMFQSNHGKIILAADFEGLQERKWLITRSVKTGTSLENGEGDRKFRVLFVYLSGYLPYGQFFRTVQVNSYGLEIQLEL